MNGLGNKRFSSLKLQRLPVVELKIKNVKFLEEKELVGELDPALFTMIKKLLQKLTHQAIEM